MKKKIGVIFCALLMLAMLTCAAVLPASAVDVQAEPQADDTLIIGVYYYDADGKLIEQDPVYGMPLNQPLGYNLKNAQVAFDDIAHMSLFFGAVRTEVRLQADVPTALSVPAGATTTLNLNGFTLSTADGTAPMTVAEGGALTITDTSADKSGKIAYTGTAAVSAVENHGRLTIGTANVTTASSAALIANSGSTARIAVKGGNFDTNGAGNFANGTGARIAVSGGIFTEEVLDEYCAAGYEPLTIETGKYSVTPSAYDDRFGETLTVVGQAAVTEGGAAYYPIDVVCGIDALTYKAVGVEYRVIRTGASPLDTTGTKETDKVHTAVNLTSTAGTQSVCKPTDLGAAYLYSARLLFDTSAYTEANTVVRITPYAVGLDGVTVYRGRTIELDGDVCAASGVTLFAKGE